MDAALAAVYPDLALRHWWWRARRHVITDELARLGEPDGSLQLLEVGCAAAANFSALEAFGEVRGLEPEEALLPSVPALRERVTHAALDADFEPATSPDRLLLLDVLEHVDDPVELLVQARRVLAPGGRLLLTVPAHTWLWTRHDTANHHRLRYSLRSMREHCEAAGWGFERARFLFHGLVGPKLLAAGLERMGLSGSGLPSVPPGPINGLASAWFRVEHRLLGPLRLPFGSSLLAVLRPRP